MAEMLRDLQQSMTREESSGVTSRGGDPVEREAPQPRNTRLQFVNRHETDLAAVEFEIQMAERLARGMSGQQPS